MRSVCSLAALLCLTAPTFVRADEPALPRYQLKPGQEIHLKSESMFKYTNGGHGTKGDWTVWVVKDNGDGSFRLVIKQSQAFSAIEKDGKTHDQPARVNFAYCDFFPDGAHEDNDSLGYSLQIRGVLPALPRNAQEMKDGYSRHNARLDQTLKYRRLPEADKDGLIAFEVKREEPMNKIYGFDNRDVVLFDTKKGLPAKIEATYKQTYGFNGTGTGTTTVGETTTRDAAWMTAFAADADRYFRAKQAYDKLTEEAGKETTEEACQKKLDEAEAVLKAAVAPVKQEELRADLQNLAKQHRENMAKYYLDEMKRRATVLNKPAHEFETTDIDGTKHALKDYRGKVVILDFWYRGCGWCVRAMPQMKEIATHFKDRPVVVFGMNTDRNEEDARFVIKEMGLNYGTLKAEGLPKKFGVQGFPTLLILDGDGVVRDIHVGYSQTLKEEAIKSVEKLLSEKK